MIKKLILLLIFLSVNVHATSVSFLWGNNFRDDLGYDSKKLTMTIEHFGVWDHGTVFFYYDITEPFSDSRGDSNQFFGGISPTFSLSSLTGRKWSYGVIKDVSIRLELENGSGYGQFNFRNYFYGLQYDLALPGFDFFSFNTVLRDNPNRNGVGFQIGTFWQMSWTLSDLTRYKFTGFLAAAPFDGNGTKQEFNPMIDRKGRFLMTQPQFLYDLGYLLHGKPDRLEIGIELLVALNRYQLSNRNEYAPQAMIKMSY